LTLVVAEIAKPFYEKRWVQPRTLAPDALSNPARTVDRSSKGDKRDVHGLRHAP